MTTILRTTPGRRASMVALTAFLLAYLAVLAVIAFPHQVAGTRNTVQAPALR